MARTPLYLLNRKGRYFARILVPPKLRPFLEGMTELREPLGPDLRIAKEHLATVVAGLQQRLAVAKREASLASGKAVEAGRFPLPVDQIVLRNYNETTAVIGTSEWRMLCHGVVRAATLIGVGDPINALLAGR